MRGRRDMMNPPIQGACVMYMMNRNRQTRGACLRYEEPESPNEGACLRFMLNPKRETRGHVYYKIHDEPESPRRGQV